MVILIGLQPLNFEPILLPLGLEDSHIFAHLQKFLPMCADIGENHPHTNSHNNRDEAENKV